MLIYVQVPPTKPGGFGLYPLAGASGLHGSAGAKSTCASGYNSIYIQMMQQTFSKRATDPAKVHTPPPHMHQYNHHRTFTTKP